MAFDASELLRKTVFNLAKEGYSHRDISNLTGVSKTSVGEWLLHDGFVPQEEPVEHVDPIELHRRKLSDAQQR